MSQRIDAVVFDIGNVLVQWDPRNLYRKLFKDPDEMEWFLTHVCSPEWNLRQDEGRTWDEAINELTQRFPALAKEIRAYRERWSEMVPGPVDGMPDVYEAVGRAGLKRYAISNFAEDTYRITAERFPFLSTLDGAAVSGVLKMVKPDTQIFRWLIESFGVAPARAIFVDDVAANVEAARDLGFHAVLFRDAEQFTDNLAELGVSLAPASNAA